MMSDNCLAKRLTRDDRFMNRSSNCLSSSSSYHHHRHHHSNQVFLTSHSDIWGRTILSLEGVGCCPDVELYSQPLYTRCYQQLQNVLDIAKYPQRGGEGDKIAPGQKPLI